MEFYDDDKRRIFIWIHGSFHYFYYWTSKQSPLLSNTNEYLPFLLARVYLLYQKLIVDFFILLSEMCFYFLLKIVNYFPLVLKRNVLSNIVQ